MNNPVLVCAAMLAAPMALGLALVFFSVALLFYGGCWAVKLFAYWVTDREEDVG